MLSQLQTHNSGPYLSLLSLVKLATSVAAQKLRARCCRPGRSVSIPRSMGSMPTSTSVCTLVQGEGGI